jgi:shikimate kinase
VNEEGERANIVLTGFMGCGKSTVGRILADRLKFRFVDTDRLIEERCAMAISKIFAIKGEAAFRSLEEGVAVELGKLSALVIATGGKLMLNPANVRALGAHGQIFCLTASPEEILRRVGGDKGIKRPLLQGEHPHQRIIALLEERREGYRCFMQIDTEGKSPQTVAEEVLRLLAPLN